MSNIADPTATTNAHDIVEKRWYTRALRLSQLEERLRQLREKLEPSSDPLIVGVVSPRYPREAPYLGACTRSSVLEDSAGREINQATDAGEELEEVIEHISQFNAECFAQGGEVIYLLFGETADDGTEHFYS